MTLVLFSVRKRRRCLRTLHLRDRQTKTDKWAGKESNYYWSSSTNANNTNNAWIVNMNNGNVNNNNKANNNYVWPVRGGEWNSNAPDAPSSSALFRDLYISYLRCRAGKRGAVNALRFEYRLEQNLLQLAEELACGRYRPARSIRFAVPRPKMREIIAADFRDRIVHHYLVERLERIFEPVFIHDSYACRLGKGVHRAVSRVRDFIRQGSANSRRPLFALHLDVKNFFMSIDRDILDKIVTDRLIRAKHNQKKHGVPHLDFLSGLARMMIRHDALAGRIDKGNRQLLDRIPPHKTLLGAPQGKGLPIGNLTSQFFANVYLNELDQFCKHKLKCRYYVRYCDDFLILDESPEKLAKWREQIREFLRQCLALDLNERYAAILPVNKGIDFLGYIIRPDYVLVRRRSVNALKVKLKAFEKQLVEKNADTGRVIHRFDYPVLEKLRGVLASYLGHFQWADTNRLRLALFARYSFLNTYYRLDEKGMPQFTANYQGNYATFRGQCRMLAARFPDAVVFIQVGHGFIQTGRVPMVPYVGCATSSCCARGTAESGMSESRVRMGSSCARGGELTDGRNRCANRKAVCTPYVMETCRVRMGSSCARGSAYSPQWVRAFRMGEKIMQRRVDQLLLSGQKAVIVRETGRRLGHILERLPAQADLVHH